MAQNGIGKLKPEQAPKDFDWDMWLGPRAYRPYQHNIAPYMFRWWSDYSSQMGNWGVHYMDAIRWLMGETASVALATHESLLWDAEKERFTNSEAANKMLSCEY